MKNEILHIGIIIQKKMYAKGMSTTKLGKIINRSREATRCILQRDSINTNMLIKISKALDYDFFQEYSKTLKDE